MTRILRGSLSESRIYADDTDDADFKRVFHKFTLLCDLGCLVFPRETVYNKVNTEAGK